MNWKEAIHNFTFYLKLERGLSENSITSYTMDIEKLIAYLDQFHTKYTPLTVDQALIQQFLYDLSRMVSARTQARIVSGLRGFFGYLVLDGHITNNPLEHIDLPKIGRKIPDTLSVQEIDIILKQIDLSDPLGERNRAIIETLYGCGLRVTELVELKLSQLFFAEGFIVVTGKGDKQRMVPLGEHTSSHILRYKDHIRCQIDAQPGHEDVLFLNRRGKQLTRAMIFTVIKRLVQKAGMQKNISPHTFRHSFATHLLENGADIRAIQLMLGHESITTTEVYTHLNQKHLRKVLETYHPFRACSKRIRKDQQ